MTPRHQSIQQGSFIYQAAKNHQISTKTINFPALLTNFVSVFAGSEVDSPTSNGHAYPERACSRPALQHQVTNTKSHRFKSLKMLQCCLPKNSVFAVNSKQLQRTDPRRKHSMKEMCIATSSTSKCMTQAFNTKCWPLQIPPHASTAKGMGSGTRKEKQGISVPTFFSLPLFVPTNTSEWLL